MTSTALAMAVLVVLACLAALGGGPVRDRLANVSARRVLREERGYELLGYSGRGGRSGNPIDVERSEKAAQQRTQRLQVVACLLAAVALFVLVGGVMGAGLAAAVAIAGPRLLRRMEPGDERRRRVQIEVSAAMVADLLAACLASGASTPAATGATASAVGGPTAELLNQCVAQFELGADHRRVWAPLMGEPALAPIARAILRSAETGAPLTATLLRVGDDLRSTRKAQLDQAAQAVGVKAVGPLGLCFLPAFMLLGVVPLIASLIANGLQ
ncbi:MAG: type II secretion system F family protein [Actinobacteria bacterium]|nr:type II secretion system F family protein [Actinomycetota bacterium]